MSPAGPLSIAMETLRTMLSTSTNFQSFLGADSPDAAVLRTYLASLPPAAEVSAGDGSQEYTPAQLENTLRPFCLCYTAPTSGFRRVRESRFGFQDHGKLFIELECAVPANLGEGGDQTADVDPEDADRTIANAVGQIMDDLTNLSALAGNLDIAEVALAAGPSRERFEELGGSGEYYWILLEVTYGPD